MIITVGKKPNKNSNKYIFYGYDRPINIGDEYIAVGFHLVSKSQYKELSSYLYQKDTSYMLIKVTKKRATLFIFEHKEFAEVFFDFANSWDD